MSKDWEQIIEKLIEEDEYPYIGIRIQDKPFKLGEINHLSHVWDDNIDTEEELPGVCAVSAKEIEACEKALSGGYYGDHAAILVSKTIEYGEDYAEIIMEDATVVEILR